MDYTTRTRQDWLDFDEARKIAFEPTPEELEQEAVIQEDIRRQQIDNKLSSR